MEGSSSSNPGYPYPYPSHVCAPNVVTMKLSGRETYDVWRTQMLCLLEGHDMLRFIHLRALGKEKVGDNNHQLWRRSDALVKGWILGSLSEQPLKFVVNLVKTKTSKDVWDKLQTKTNKDFTSKDVWDKLQTIYGPPLQDAAAAANVDDETIIMIYRKWQHQRRKEEEMSITGVTGMRSWLGFPTLPFLSDGYKPNRPRRLIISSENLKPISDLEVKIKHAQGKEKVGGWRRSDALVKAWILSSLSQETLKYVIKPNKDHSTAEQVWKELRTIYGPLSPLAEGRIRLLEDMRDEEEKKVRIVRVKRSLYSAILTRDFEKVESVLREKVVTLSDKITISGNTALHVAVATTNKDKEFLKKMLDMATQDNLQPLDRRNSQGSTLLHVAAIVGNTEAAKMLVEKNQYLLYLRDNEDQTPVARALSNMHTHTYRYLWESSLRHRDIELDDIGDCELLVNIISSKDYESAYSLLYQTNRLPKETDTVLMAIAQNFPTELNFWESIVSAGAESSVEVLVGTLSRQFHGSNFSLSFRSEVFSAKRISNELWSEVWFQPFQVIKPNVWISSYVVLAAPYVQVI
ncbi:hypothetical protein L1987_87723 [Smallanthus sonchifolius]|nr:hypothetical protein L1987_87723 [Smallanthus sonchifolius]